MPNYCHNTIKIKGKTKNMKKFYDAITETYNGATHKWLTFQKTVPLDTFNDATTIWGTKWDLNPPKSVADQSYDGFNEYEIITQTNKIYEIRCNTAWSPPTRWAESCSRKYKISIRIAYVESGFDYYGVFRVSCAKTSTISYDSQIRIRDYVSKIGDNFRYGVCDLDNYDDVEIIPERKSYLHDGDNHILLTYCSGNFYRHIKKYNLTSLGG